MCTRSIYIELPDEESEGGKYVGRLIRALYGTQDAPLACQTVVRSDMKMLGFDGCKVTNGVFTHRERDLRAEAHVDVFPRSGEMQDLSWFRDRLKETHELKVQVAGWGRGDARELSFLGRVIRTTPAGIELEGDDKHVEKLEEEWGMVNCNPVATPPCPAHRFVPSTGRS